MALHDTLGWYESQELEAFRCLFGNPSSRLGTGAVFKMVGNEYPAQVGAVTGVVGAAGGLGGFFPPLVMGFVKTALGSYTLGFLLLAFTAVLCLAILVWMIMRPSTPQPASKPPAPLPAKTG